MIAINGYDITFSRGDTFQLSLKLEGMQVSKDDFAVFAISQLVPDNKIVYSQEIALSEDNVIDIVVDGDDMANIKAGVYRYDVAIIQAGVRQTLFFPATLTIVEVAHDV